jgi:CHAT domain-containing protein
MRIIPSLLSIGCLLLLTNLLYGQDSLAHYNIQQLDSIFEDHKKVEAFDRLYPYAQAAVVKAKEQYGTEGAIYASALHNLGFAFDYGVGNMEKAMTYYKEALSIQKKQIPNSIDCANTMVLIADIYNYNLVKYKKAESFYVEAMVIWKEVGDVNQLEYLSILSNLAGLYGETSRYDLAKQLYLEAMNLWKKKSDVKDSKYTTFLNNLALFYIKIGEDENAEALLLESIAIRKELFGVRSSSYVNSLNSLATLYGVMRRYDSAAQLYLEALAIWKEVLGERHPNYAISLSNLGALYQRIKTYEKAAPLLYDAMQIWRKSLGEQSPNYAAAMNNLAVLYMKTGKLKEAKSLYWKAMRIRKKSVGKGHPAYAMALNNLAGVEMKMGEYRRAESFLLEAMAIRKDALGIYHTDYVISLNNLTKLYIKTGKEEKANEYIIQTLFSTTGLEMSLEVTPSWADSLLNANFTTQKQVDYLRVSLRYIYDILSKKPSKTNKQKQVIVSDLVMNLLRSGRDRYFAQKDKLLALSKSNDWMLRSLKVLDKKTQVAKAFKFAEQSKSVLLMEATKTERAYNFGDLPDSLVRQEKMFFKKHEKLAASLVKKRPEAEKDSLQNILNNLHQKIDVFKKKIEKDYPKYAKSKYQQVDVVVEDIQVLLDEKSALIEYVVGDSVVYIFYIDKKNLKLIEFYVDNKILKNKIKQFHNVLSNYSLLAKKGGKSYQLYTKLAYEFYKNLLEPALSNAKGIEHLIFVTDGELGHLPFEVFLMKSAPPLQTSYANLHYILNDYRVSYNYSAALWKESVEGARRNNNGQILAMASSYDFSQDALKMESRLPTYKRLRKVLSPLPAAIKEVEVLAENFDGFFCLNTMSSEEIFKDKAVNYGVIHLAMHGLLDNQHPIFSSLAFSEDGGDKENNFLQAYEISKMRLNADLVVLSACETGYGKFEQGNGIASLARAFTYAGVSSLVVSLWQVNDYATSQLMKSFYQNLVEGMNKAEALRQAKLVYLKSSKDVLAHPAFWSSFIQIGDSRSIFVATKGRLPWGWIIGSIVLLLGGLIFLRKRLSYNG